MAALNFPANPTDGQQYPDPAVAGVNVYRYSSVYNTWELLGVASGAVPGTYGTDHTTLEVSVGPTGVITDINELAIRASSLTQTGIVQLNDTLDSFSITEALTANQGRALYDLIINGAGGNGVTFVNIDDISPQFDGALTSFVLRSSLALVPSTVTAEELLIEVGGILQSPGANYTWDPLTSVITFTSAPLASYAFSGRYFTTIGNTVAVIDGIDDISSQFNGTFTTFSVTSGGAALPTNTQTDDILIEVGGINQEPAVNWSFNAGASTITFTTAPPAGLAFSGRFVSTVGTSVLLQALNDISGQFNGVETNFFVQSSSGILPTTTASAQLVIFVGGILQAPGTNYVYNANSAVLSFTSPPSSGWSFDGRAAIVTGVIPRGTVTSVNTGEGLTGGPITSAGTIFLAPATTATLGGVKPDSTNFGVSLNGVLTLAPATTTTLGGVKVDGSTITVSPTGVISVVSAPSLWQETGGILSPTVSGSSVTAVDFIANGTVRSQAGNTGVYAGFDAVVGAMHLFASSSTSNADFEFYANGSATQPIAIIDSIGGITSLSTGATSGALIAADFNDPVSSNLAAGLACFIPGANTPQNALITGADISLHSFGNFSDLIPETTLKITSSAFQVRSPSLGVNTIIADTTTGNVDIGGTLSFNVGGAGTSVLLPGTRGVSGQILTTAGDGTTFWGAAGSSGTVTSVATGTGLTGGPITTSGTISLSPATVSVLGGVIPDGTTIGVAVGGTISLSNTAVTPGTYTAANITVDAQGRITAAANGSGGGGGTVTSVATGTGLTGGPVTTTGTIALANTSVVPGAYTAANITVDAQGRITSAANGTGGGGGGVSFSQIDDIASQFNGTQTVFNLLSGGSPLPSGLNAEQLLISLGGVLQYPFSAYTYAGSQITFTTAPLSSYTFSGRYSIPPAVSGGTVTQVNTGAGLSGGPITGTGTISLTPATVSALGGVIPDGTTITVLPNGTISAVAGGSGTVTQVNTGTGLTGGPISTTGTISLAAGGITNTEVSATAAIESSKLQFTQSGTGATARTVQARLRDVISVKDFGAVGDGVVDDTTAIQGAIDAGPGIIFFPAGTYRFTSLLTISTSIHLLGTGFASTLLYDGASDAILMTYAAQNNSPQFEISDLTILNGVATSGTCIELRYTGPSDILGERDRLRMCNVFVGCSSLSSWWDTGLLLNNSAAVNLVDVSISNGDSTGGEAVVGGAAVEMRNTKIGHNMIRTLQAVNCYFKYFNTCVWMNNTNASTSNSTIETCYISNSEHLGNCGFKTTGNVSAFAFSNSHFDTITECFLVPHGGYGRITGCDIRGRGTNTGALIRMGSTNTAFRNGGGGVVVTGNYINTNNTATFTNPVISLEGGNNGFVVNDNFIFGFNRQVGVQLANNVDNVIVSGNKFFTVVTPVSNTSSGGSNTVGFTGSQVIGTRTVQSYNGVITAL